MAVDCREYKTLRACVHSIRKQRLLNTVNSLCTAVVFCAVFLCHVESSLGVGVDAECSAVRAGFQTRGFNASDLLQQPTNGNHLRVCPILDRTCCSEATETRLQVNSKHQFEKTVKDSLVKLSSVLNTRSQRFDDFFRDMLNNSKKDFHEMFKKTYGVIYVQNSYVFTDLFQELENYYNKGQVDLADAMDNFFSVLYQRMFTVINSQYQFDEKYLSCVADHMKDLKPFGDVPQKLSIQIKRSFVAARTFARALFIGAEATRNMLNIKTSQECSKSLLRMQHCAGCSGHPQVRACSNYCINVMKGCLAYHSNLETEWNYYVDAMDKIADRLLGSFNIEMVVDPIDIKISEAIMNFQENGPDVSQRVFTGCGKPVLGRKRRSLTVNPLQNSPGLSESHHNLLRNKFIHPQPQEDSDLEFDEGSPPSPLERRKHLLEDSEAKSGVKSKVKKFGQKERDVKSTENHPELKFKKLSFGGTKYEEFLEFDEGGPPSPLERRKHLLEDSKVKTEAESRIKSEVKNSGQKRRGVKGAENHPELKLKKLSFGGTKNEVFEGIEERNPLEPRKYLQENSEVESAVKSGLKSSKVQKPGGVKRRVLRATENQRELKFETLSFGGTKNENGNEQQQERRKGGGAKVAHVKPEAPTLEKLIKDIRHIVKESKKFWSHLPYQICNNEELAEGPSNEKECWNGTTVDRYTNAVVSDGLANQKQNPDVFVDINKQNSILNEQIYALKTITNKILNAYQGMDVEWIDTEESLPTYASGGSGSGDMSTDLSGELGSGSSPFDPSAGSGPGGYPVDHLPIVPRINFPPETPNTNSNSSSTGDIPHSGSGAGRQMTLARALAAYLFPLVVIWFGGMFAELL